MNRKLLVTAAVSLTLLATAACGSSPAPGEAAYVGDRQITVAEVQDDTAEVLAAAALVSESPLDAAEVNRRQVNRLITQALIEEEAARRGVSVTDADVDQLLRQAIGGGSRDDFAVQLAAGQLVPPSRLDEFARTVALNERLLTEVAPGVTDQNAATAELITVLGALSDELGTGVAARFGTWDPADLTVALPPNDLSTPAPQVQVTAGSVEAE